MEPLDEQAELFGLIWQSSRYPYRLRVNDVIRIGGHLGVVVRVNECAAVVVMNRPPRVFHTRFDKPVRFQPPPIRFRISANSEIEILNRNKPALRRAKRKEAK